jgi:hypothetical protein
MSLSPTVWIAGALCVVTAALVLPRLQQPSSATTSTAPAAATGAACKSIEAAQLELLLDDNRQEAMADFKARAGQLVAEGRCVVEGGWSNRRQSFFYALDTNGDPAQREYRWYTREQLKP